MVTNCIYTSKHVPSNEIVLVTLKEEVERVFNFTTVTQRIFNYVVKKLNFDLLTHPPGSGGYESAGKIFATMLMHLYFHIT